ncbi:DgyrCDS14375 [Dimorphilus gyrociliatus]|uniref:DgyrCDS14375 n=1 Tax=Dimorphilus gyrociliatus TaxID=2664684 RepID=A0A7I8WDC8_9ANNE|nr:DgyrCDS14375 [Dimorphilus gyrociliatus]
MVSLFRFFVKTIVLPNDDSFNPSCSAPTPRNTNVTIRFMKEDDIDHVHKLIYKGFCEKWEFAYNEKAYEYIKFFSVNRYKGEHSKRNDVLVAEFDNKVLGVCQISVYKPNEKFFTLQLIKHLSNFPLWSMITTITSSGMVTYLKRRDPDEASIELVTVDEKARGLGIGDQLLTKAHDVCRERNMNKVSLIVVLSNVYARRLYERHGYRTLKIHITWKMFLWGTEGCYKMEKKLN